ncbi:MAG: CoA pyrophosphatase [Gluconacetobacter diazotrophicus]|nr:CoA pyrophosphatase [Gluconacetobacter diazotrophicus]
MPPPRARSWPTNRTGLAAVLVPVVLAPEPFVLLTRRSARLRTHPGQVSFPGGRADPGDPDPVATALRESEEEIGLLPALVEPLALLPDQPTMAGGTLITPVLALLPATIAVRPTEAEVAAILGLPLSTLLDPDAPILATDGPRAGTWSWPHPDHDIWGATAAILVRLAGALRERSG